MRVAIVGNRQKYRFEWHLEYTLLKMNHQACIFDGQNTLLHKALPGRVIDLLQRANTAVEMKLHGGLVKAIAKYQPDLVVVCFSHLPPGVIAAMKRELGRAPVVHVNSDHMITMSIHRQYILCSPFDAWFTKDRIQLEFMRNKLGLNAFYLPEAFNPDFHKPPQETEGQDECDIMVVANVYPYKGMILDRLYQEIKDSDVRMTIHGDIYRWMDSSLRHLNKPQLFAEEKAKAFYSSKICLNVFHYAEINSVNCRFFEIVGSGGFQICDDTPAVYEFLERDREIVTFRTYDELREKIRYYLGHSEERTRMRKRAHEKFKDRHTYARRIESIFKAVGIGGVRRCDSGGEYDA